MKKLLLLCCGLMLVSFSAFAQKKNIKEPEKPQIPIVTEIPFNIPEIQQIETKGGLKAWLIEEKSTPVIAVSVLFKGGAASDPIRLQGLTTLATSLLDEGAGTIKAQQFQQILAERAISLNFSSGADYIAVDMETLANTQNEAFHLLSLALTQPRFDRVSLRNAKQEIIAGIETRKGNPNALAYERFLKLVFKDHPYSRILPSKTGITATTRANLKKFIRQRFAKDNISIGVVGNITADQLKPLLDSTFKNLSNHAVLPEIADFVPTQTARTDVLTMDVPQSAVVFGHKGLKRSDPDYFAALIVNYAFGNGSFASRLFNQVREQNGLAYSVSTSLLPLKKSPMFIGSAASDNAKLSGAIDIIKTEWEKMAANGLTEKELIDAKTYLTGSFPLSFTSSEGLASFLASLQFNDENIDYLKTRNDRMKAVTIDDAKRAANRLLDPASLFFVVVGKPANL